VSCISRFFDHENEGEIMWKKMGIFVALLGIVILLAQAQGQPPGDKKGKGKAKGGDVSIVDRMMAFDKNSDGVLTRDEITDERLLRLFERADANKDGVVTREELVALDAKLKAEMAEEGGGRGGRGGQGPGGPPDGGPGGRGPGGRGGRGGPPDGGPGGFGGPPRPGQILPAFMQDELNLNADQKKQLNDLQKEVDARMAKILTSEQKKQLDDMRMGPGGPGGRGPGGGRGGRGGPPDGGPDRQ
jgi:Ca2+-binding EF-hand superfamily protein